MAVPQFEERLKALPTAPGVYLFRNDPGEVLYVGKAANLRNRVRTYFGSPWSLTPKIQRLTSHIADLEFFVTDSEAEALILENTLIKRHQPRYNVRLKDDKTYPFIKIDITSDFPRVEMTRRVVADGSRYFGPFASASSLRRTMDLVKRLFPYRSCTKVITGTDPRPCLEYYIHRCVAPCTGYATKEQYREVIHQVIQFLEGRHETIVKSLRRQMEAASEQLEFERAVLLRDQLQAIERVMEEQKMVSVEAKNQDVIALATNKDEAWVEAFFIRNGKLIGRDHFILEGAQDEEPAHLMTSFLKQFYASAPFIPPELLLQVQPNETDLVARWLSEKRGSKVHLTVPVRGEKKQLVAMVAENAAKGLEQMRMKLTASQDAATRATEELKEQLNLPRLPLRIEGYDISNIHGTSAVGSMVVFQNGQPKKAHYRRFKIKAVEGIDDYAMMQEMLRRRFKRSARQEQPSTEESWAASPDLVLIDGGKGHLNAALQVFLELGLKDISLASIAKEHEELFVPDIAEPIILSRTSPALFLVQRVRDEAHRFAITYHQKLRSRGAWQSVIDSLPGIGPKRKRELLRRFGSVKAMREATVEELAAVPGMTMKAAQKVKGLL
jgi:excinuclease ABC subunit C